MRRKSLISTLKTTKSFPLACLLALGSVLRVRQWWDLSQASVCPRCGGNGDTTDLALRVALYTLSTGDARIPLDAL